MCGHRCTLVLCDSKGENRAIYWAGQNSIINSNEFIEFYLENKVILFISFKILGSLFFNILLYKFQLYF